VITDELWLSEKEAEYFIEESEGEPPGVDAEGIIDEIKEEYEGDKIIEMVFHLGASHILNHQARLGKYGGEE